MIKKLEKRKREGEKNNPELYFIRIRLGFPSQRFIAKIIKDQMPNDQNS